MLHDFPACLEAIVGSRFRAIYLSGSLALGRFDPHNSHIDVVVVTDAEIAEDLFVALQAMHALFGASSSPWAVKVEAVYIPRDALRNSAPTPAQCPQIEKGGILFRGPLESGWPIQCHILRERGVVAAGPDPRTLIGPVDPADMRRASVAIATAWREQARHDPAWLAWLQHRDAQAFVVLTLCRLLHTLDSASVASKPVAARWAQKVFGERWAGLIERSLAGQHDRSETPESDVDDTVALMQYTVERSHKD